MAMHVDMMSLGDTHRLAQQKRQSTSENQVRELSQTREDKVSKENSWEAVGQV